MKISRRLLLVFTGSILLPGLILGYLSFRSVKDERVLLERSLESRHQDFVGAVLQILRKTRQVNMDKLREQLRAGGSTDTPAAAWALTARLLENPMVQSAAVFRGDTAVFPRDPNPSPNLGAAPGPGAPPALADLARQEWHARRYGACLRALRGLLHGPDSLTATPTLEPLRFGFRLLELKCLVALGDAPQAITFGRVLIRDLQATDVFDSYHPVAFYLSETVNLLTSLEALPPDLRAQLFTLHQQLPLFLSDADFVQHAWPASPTDMLRSQIPFPEDSLKVQYYEGVPYLEVGFPWFARGTQALLRLNENVFVEALRSDLLAERRETWKDVDFAILNRLDRVVLASDSLSDREPALEKSVDDGFPAWRVIVYKKPASEVVSLGRRRLILQYTLLGFSLLALLLGAFTLFQGIDQEQRVVQMKANFLSAVSHELKTPLTAIRMFAEMLASGRQAQEEKRRDYAQRIEQEAERLQGMIEGILNFARLEEDERALRFAELDLSEVARESAALMGTAFAQAGIRLTTLLPATARLRADYDALRSVLQNLLENALKYSPSGTEVTLEVRDEPENVVLRVADQGIGIAPGDLKHIFEKFYRAGDEMTRKTRGSGLGLALVQRIVAAHGGVIKVRSAENQGTEMIITFAKGGKHASDSHR